MKITKIINLSFLFIIVFVSGYLLGAFTYTKDKPCVSTVIKTVSERKDACEKLGGEYHYYKDLNSNYTEYCQINKEIKDF